MTNPPKIGVEESIIAIKKAYLNSIDDLNIANGWNETILPVVKEALTTIHQQGVLSERERIEGVLASVTDDFDDIYSKFPAREAAVIIRNRINNLISL